MTERKAADAIPALKELALHGATQEICLRGLWALYGVGGFDAQFANVAMRSHHEWVRVWTIRFLGESLPLDKWELERDTLAALLEHAATRSQLASTFQRLKGQEILPLLTAQLGQSDADANDANIPLLLWIAYEPFVLTSFPKVLEFLKGDGAKSAFVRGYIAPRVARRLVSTQKTENLSQAFELLDTASALEMRAALIDGIQLGFKGRGKVTPPENWEKVFAAAQQRNDAVELKKLKLLAAQFGDAASLADAQKIVADSKRPAAERIEALKLLSSFNAPGVEKFALKSSTAKAMRNSRARRFARWLRLRPSRTPRG